MLEIPAPGFLATANARRWDSRAIAILALADQPLPIVSGSFLGGAEWFWVVLSGLDRPPSIATQVSSDFLEVRFFRTSLSCERFSPELSFLWLSFSMLEVFCWQFP
jgi:hypothetical protein